MTKIRTTRRAKVYSFVKIISDFNKSVSARVIDISPRGIRIKSKDPFLTDRPFKCSLLFPNINFREKVIKFDASVAWNQESDVDGYYETGLHIESVEPEDKSILEQFIEDSKLREVGSQSNESLNQEH